MTILNNCIFSKLSTKFVQGHVFNDNNQVFMDKIRKLQNDIHDIYFKTDKCDVLCRKFEIEIQNLNEQIFNKAEFKDLTNLENKVNEIKNTYTPFKLHLQLKNSLEDYVSKEENNGLLQDMNKCKQIIDTMCTFDKMKQEMERFSEDFARSHTDYVMKKDLNSQVNRFLDEVNDLKKIREVDRNKIMSLSEEVQLISITIPKLIRSDEAKATMLLAVSDLREQMDSIIPISEDCCYKIREFAKDIKGSKEIIERFDEIMLEKASKISLEELKREFKEYKEFDHQFELRTQFNNTDLFVRNEISGLRENIIKYKKELQSNIITSMRKFCNDVNSQLRNGAQDVTVTKREFEQRLGLKIDRIDFDSKTKEKADANKVNECNRLLINTHSQLNHTIVILIEALKLMLRNPNDTEITFTTKLNYILKQALSIYNWSEKSFENSTLINDNNSCASFRNQISRRSRDCSPLQLDLLEIKNDDHLKITPFSTTLNSPISINKLK